MKLLQRLLLVPCLAPLLALLLIAVSTTRTPSRLQILLWTSNPQPIGLWMALAGVGGAGLSGLAALLLMPAAPSLRRQIHQPVEPNRSIDDFGINLKPARAMGMRTIKVGCAQDAIDGLYEVFGDPI